MADFASLRRTMVDGQVRTADVTDRPLIQAMLDLPRERFVPPAKAALAYLDLDLPLSGTRRMLKPMVLAKMMQALDISPSDRALDVGCTTGYAAALLSLLAASVVALEEDASLLDRARANLQSFATGKIELVQGPLMQGHAARAPYDVILVEGAIAMEPTRLCEQLADSGRLICIRGTGPAAKATLYRRDAGDVSPRTVFDAAGPALPGFSRPAAFAF
jgi:protein-L-isoaspartate(D-aspartate) O-methyltransferase